MSNRRNSEDQRRDEMLRLGWKNMWINSAKGLVKSKEWPFPGHYNHFEQYYSR